MNTRHFVRQRAGLPSYVAAVLLGCAGFVPGVDAAETKAAEPKKEAAPAAAAKPLFDGKTLAGWKITDFAGHGEVKVKDGTIALETGHMTGVTWTNALPTENYEIALEAMRVEGSDFFCGLTFPVGKEHCSFIVGGWGGGVVGLSSLNGEDASSNETSRFMNFQTGRWYKIRLRVASGSILAWIDADKVVDVSLAEKTLSIRLEVEPSKPLGISTWNTAAALRNLTLRKL